MSFPTFSDKRNAASAEQIITLEEARITVTENGQIKRAIAYEDLARLRLGVEMAGRDSQIVARLKGKDGVDIIFGSRKWAGVGLWNNQALAFRDFNTQLHQRLLAHRETIEFIEGQPIWFSYVMSGMGVVLALMGAAFLIYFLLEESPAFMGGVPGILIGGYLAWMFKPKAPQPYDPAIYADSNQ